MNENLHPAVVRDIEKETQEKLLASLKKRGYWCPRCDQLAPPIDRQFTQKGKNGFCEGCFRNPIDKDAA